MRALPAPIALALDSGILIGLDRAQVRLTVEPAWFLTPVSSNLGAWPPQKSPIRYWQTSANDQAVIEVPNIVSINIDRSVATPAAACEVVIDNVWMDGNMSGHIDRLGTPGYFTPTRGATDEAIARWGDEPNEWFGLLEENSLLRTYEGVGDDTQPIGQALEAGQLMLSGVWLVDDWRATSDGQLTLSCRDMMSILIDQIIYPPLVPSPLYPLTYYRWDYFNVPLNAGSINVSVTTPPGEIAAGDKRTVYRTSSTDAWYGFNFLLHGHRGTDSVDGNVDTFALSVGNSSPDRPFCTDYFEYDCGEAMNAVWVHPWGGNYITYISIMENGVWQGDPNVLVPYDFDALEAVQPGSVDTGADIPYVSVSGVGWETPTTIILPRVYNADRMRISFRNHTRSPWGPWYYRCGIREIRNQATTGVAVGGSTETLLAQPVFFGADHIQDPDDPTHIGYITTSMFGQVDAFGDARVMAPNGTAASTSALEMSIRLLPDAGGYYVLDLDGTVLAFGAAVWYGDPKTSGFQSTPNVEGVHDMAVTHTGLGYWVITGQGHLFAYGDAVQYTATIAPSGVSGFLTIESHPTDYGIWVADGNGVVSAFGASVNLGNFTEVALNHDHTGDISTAQEAVISLRAHPDGNGYWIATTTGRVQNFGSAADFGQLSDNTIVTSFFDQVQKILPGSDGLGFLLLRGDGTILGPFGDIINFGSPAPGGQSTQRRPGNYLDYVDIVRDILLWSGYFFAFELNAETGMPEVYGNLESTGAFAPDTLPLEMFDKKPPFDPIKQLAELVGYIMYVDEEGGIRWHTPNWWNFGNFFFDGTHTTEIHELDERWNLISATIGSTKANDRSEIIISTEEPTEGLDDTVTTRFIPPEQSRLRGMTRPGMWVQGALGDAVEQQAMAELVNLHLWFRRRTATVTGLNHPGVSINDQIRILDRATGETSVHYVLNKVTRFNRESREWLMELTTHWLGDRDNWAISTDGTTETTTVNGVTVPKFALSATTVSILEQRGIYLDQVNENFITRLTPVGAIDPGGEGAAT